MKSDSQTTREYIQGRIDEARASRREWTMFMIGLAMGLSLMDLLK